MSNSLNYIAFFYRICPKTLTVCRISYIVYRMSYIVCSNPDNMYLLLISNHGNVIISQYDNINHIDSTECIDVGIIIIN